MAFWKPQETWEHAGSKGSGPCPSQTPMVPKSTELPLQLAKVAHPCPPALALPLLVRKSRAGLLSSSQLPSSITQLQCRAGDTAQGDQGGQRDSPGLRSSLLRFGHSLEQ